ncbi:hypothetical protein EDC27_1994 [Desulfosoma caldarium]|uniref:Uncharacterized protein n=1 Tax=Desulfosoma caldarium TaxID=610254 RepID=A0A3N1UWI4_9BACT|nr:hypothetical protein EDC27_1994 [Desulfosoma caldarium]
MVRNKRVRQFLPTLMDEVRALEDGEQKSKSAQDDE